MIAKKRGVLLFALIFSLILVILNAHSQEEWCCTPPSITTCYETTADQCTPGYFHEGFTCNNVPECTYTAGCCISSCLDADFPAACTDFKAGRCSQQPECQRGCCFCTIDPADPSRNQCFVDKTQAECIQECAAIQYPIYFLDTSISGQSCLDQCTVRPPVKYTITGNVLDQNGNFIPGANIIAATQTTISGAGGSYSLANIIAGPITIRVEKLGYRTNLSTITIKNNTYYAVLLSKVEAGTISGIVKNDETDQPVAGVLITATGILSSTTQTNANGEYKIENLILGDYTVTASKEPQFVAQTSMVNLTAEQNIAQKDFRLTPRPLGTIRGTVKDTSQNPVSLAEIMINTVRETVTSAVGIYTKEVFAPPEGITYTVKARAKGYKDSSPVQITIKKGETKSIDFTIAPISGACAYPTNKTAESFTASHIKGLKAIKLTWETPANCNNIGGYSIFRVKVQDNNITPIAFIPVSEVPYSYPEEYIDSNVSWNTQYSYYIIVTYNDNVVRNSSAAYTSIIETGDALCEGKYLVVKGKFTEFCKNNFLRSTCNDENRIISAPNFMPPTNAPADCSEISSLHYCSGPDLNGYAHCRNVGACDPRVQQAIPFGLYYTKNGCYTSSTRFGTYCYFDYSNSIIDTCYACTLNTTCFDYRSEDACNLDNCEAGHNADCKWKPTEYTQFGKGFCYQENYSKSDYCYLCSKENTVFKNTGCTPEVCKLLGNCYSDGSSCSACAANATCESYKTQQACIGSQEIQISSCSEITPSNDACGLGKCKWNSATQECFKDGNDNNVVDCGGDYAAASQQCRTDTKAPTTVPPVNYMAINKDSLIELHSDLDAGTLSYCIDKDNTCCPTETAIFNYGTGIVQISPLDSTTLAQKYFQEGNGQGTYFIRYSATDIHANKEPVKSTVALFDLNPPQIDIVYKIIPNTSISAEGIVISNLSLNITLSEFAYCSDNLTDISTKVSESRLSSSAGESWLLSYSIKDGYYRYEIRCTDNLGNTNVTVIEPLEVDAWHYAVVKYPRGPIKETTVTFNVETQDQGSCKLYKGNTELDSFSTSNGLVHTVTKVLATNTHYSDYKAICTDTIGRKDPANFFFTIDNLPPQTISIIKIGGKEFRYNTSWNIWVNNPIGLSFGCSDILPASFGCLQTKYCIASSSQGICNPTETPPNITLSNTSTVCYYSEDKGGNVEQRKCSTVHIGEGLGIRLVKPPYGVSNQPRFDVEIEVLGDVEECKYAPLNFEYSDLGIPKFERISVNRHKITNFDGAAPPNPEFYPMNVKCRDLQGFVNDVPAVIDLLYDPTKPVIEKAWAFPEKVIQGDYTTLNVKTDDLTICRYDKNATNYNDMHGAFPESDEVSPIFNANHTKRIQLTGEDSGKTHTYNIACKNRAGDVSETKQIIFSVDFNARGAIIATLPSGSTNNPLVTLEVITSKNANCKYKEATGQLVDFATTGGTTHSSTSRTLLEGAYSHYVYCRFSNATDEGTISFIVDLTKPIVKSINISSSVCYKDFIQPTFLVEDNLSSIGQYNYSLYEVGNTNPLINWTSTTSNNPKISTIGLNLSFDKGYYLQMTAADAAGNPGDTIKSIDFGLIPINSSTCFSDKTPPTVTISTNATYKGIKIIMDCSDESGCDGKYYGISSQDQECNATEEYTTDVYLKQTSKFCWNVSDTVGNTALGSELIEVKDKDGDGVPDEKDQCPDTPYGTTVDQNGCPTAGDRDQDGVNDLDDLCPDTVLGEDVDENGCSCTQLDTDSDGINNCLDKCPGTPLGEAVDTEGCGDSQKDSDNDGMDDAWEKRYNLDPFNPADANEDIDKDGLTNREEYLYYKETGRLIDPRNKDTDGDGWTDKEEVDAGTNPVDASSHPKSRVLAIIFIVLGLLLLLLGAAYTFYMEYTTEKPIKPAPTTQYYPQRYYPSREAIESAERRRLALISMRKQREEMEKRRQELEKRREEAFAKRREEKSSKRAKFFDIFGIKQKEAALPKIPTMHGKPITKEEIEPFAKILTIPSEKTEFKKLVEMIGEYLREKKTIEPLIKITKVLPGKEDEFKKLTELIEERLNLPKEPSRELSPEQRNELNYIFYRLSRLKKEEEKKPHLETKAEQAIKKTLQEKTKKQPFKRLAKMAAKRKELTKKPFKKLEKLARKRKR